MQDEDDEDNKDDYETDMPISQMSLSSSKLI